MTELQYLILKQYHLRKEINSYEMFYRFPLQNPKYTLAQVKTEMSYLHGSLFIDSPPGKYNTLGITQLGEEKYRIEEAALTMRRRFGEGDLYQPTPIKDIKSESNKIEKKETITSYLQLFWRVLNNNLIISGMIALILGSVILKCLHII